MDPRTQLQRRARGQVVWSLPSIPHCRKLKFLLTSFEQDTGIRINFVRLSAGEMLARVQAERDNPLASRTPFVKGCNDISAKNAILFKARACLRTLALNSEQEIRCGITARDMVQYLAR